MLFGKIIAVYSDNRVKINTQWGQNAVFNAKTGITFSYTVPWRCTEAQAIHWFRCSRNSDNSLRTRSLPAWCETIKMSVAAVTDYFCWRGWNNCGWKYKALGEREDQNEGVYRDWSWLVMMCRNIQCCQFSPLRARKILMNLFPILQPVTWTSQSQWGPRSREGNKLRDSAMNVIGYFLRLVRHHSFRVTECIYACMFQKSSY
jgi:hypothetical protein